jgi:hypothetical protein
MLNPIHLIYVEFLAGPDKAVDILFEYVDELCVNGKFNVVDEFLLTINVEIQTTQVLIGILCITLMVKSKLKERSKVFAKISEKIKRTESPRRHKRLLEGLE